MMIRVNSPDGQTHPRTIAAALLLSLAAGPARAQTPAAVTQTQAAETITAADLVRHAGVLAADSLRGRDTPSRELELVAQYLTEQFLQLGLRPGVRTANRQDSAWVQRYPIPGQRHFDHAKSQVTFVFPVDSQHKQYVSARFATAAYFFRGRRAGRIRSRADRLRSDRRGQRADDPAGGSPHARLRAGARQHSTLNYRSPAQYEEYLKAA